MVRVKKFADGNIINLTPKKNPNGPAQRRLFVYSKQDSPTLGPILPWTTQNIISENKSYELRKKEEEKSDSLMIYSMSIQLFLSYSKIIAMLGLIYLYICIKYHMKNIWSLVDTLHMYITFFTLVVSFPTNPHCFEQSFRIMGITKWDKITHSLKAL